jgi:hypothetical protein
VEADSHINTNEAQTIIFLQITPHQKNYIIFLLFTGVALSSSRLLRISDSGLSDFVYREFD